MLAYAFIVTLVILPWLLLSQIRVAHREAICTGLSFVVFFIAMSLRAATVGTDTQPYLTYYVNGGMKSFQAGIEQISSAPLYNLYSWVLYQFFPFEQAILVFNSAIICIGYAVFIQKFSDNRLVGVLLFVGSYCFFDCMNAMRQNVAVALVLIAITCSLSSKKPLAIVFAIMAVLIHNVALITILIAFVARLISAREYSSAKMFAIIFVAAIVGSLGIGFALNVLATIFPKYAGYMAGGTASVGFAAMNSGRTRILWGIYLVVLVLMLFLRSSQEWLNENQNHRFLVIASIMAVSLGVVFGEYRLYIRAISTLLPILCCAYSALAAELDRQMHTVVFRGSLLLMFSAICIAFLIGNYSGVVPYITVFN